MEDAWNDCEENLPQYIWDAEELFECCGYDWNDYRRNFTDMSARARLERAVCFDRVTSCSKSAAFKIHHVDENQPFHAEETTTEFIFPTITFSPDDLVCDTCQWELVNQTNRIYNFQGGIALVVAFLELIPIYLAYNQWKNVSRTEEDVALSNFSI